MFILYAVVIGTLLGLLGRGRIERLGELPIRWAPLALLGLAGQIVLFAGPVGDAIDPDIGRYLYVASTALVLGVVLANLRLPGLPIIAAGAALNLVAILANGGSMPTDPNALEAAGRRLPEAFSNSVVVASPALQPLTDIFALPSWVPFANVFSIGDVVIFVGLVVAIAAGMRTVPDESGRVAEARVANVDHGVGR